MNAPLTWRPSQSLAKSAEIAERAGKHGMARFWREMARDALALETAIPGGVNLYRHWARDIEKRAFQLSPTKEAEAQQVSASDKR